MQRIDMQIYIPVDRDLDIGISLDDRLVVRGAEASFDLGRATAKRFDDLIEYLTRLRIHAVDRGR